MHVLRTGRIENVTTGTVAHCGAAKKDAQRGRGAAGTRTTMWKCVRSGKRAVPVMSSMRDVRGIHADRATGTTMQNVVCDNDEDETRGQTRVYMRGNK